MSKNSQEKAMPGTSKLKLSDLCDEISERVSNPSESDLDRFVGLEHMETGETKLKKFGSTTDLISAMKLFKSGDILVARRNVYLKRAAIADFDGVCSGDAIVLRPKSNRLLRDGFLKFILNTDNFWDYAIKHAAGTMSKRLSVENLLNFDFALPPIEQQGQLLELLEGLEDTLSSLTEAIDAAVALEKSRLEDALGAIPNENLTAVEKLVISAPRNGLSPKTNADELGYPTLSIGAVRDARIVVEGNLKYAEITSKEAETFALKENDVLVVRGNGNKLLTGRCGLVDVVPKGCFYPDLLIRLQFNPEIIRPEFAALQWNCQSVHTRLISRAKSTNGIWKINGADIRQHSLKVPSIKIQDVLLSEVRAIRAARQDISNRKSATLNLRSQALKLIAAGGVSGV